MATKKSRTRLKMSKAKAPRRRASDASVIYRATHAPAIEDVRADIDAAIESGRHLREEIEARISLAQEPAPIN